MLLFEKCGIATLFTWLIMLIGFTKCLDKSPKIYLRHKFIFFGHMCLLISVLFRTLQTRLIDRTDQLFVYSHHRYFSVANAELVTTQLIIINNRYILLRRCYRFACHFLVLSPSLFLLRTVIAYPLHLFFDQEEFIHPSGLVGSAAFDAIKCTYFTLHHISEVRCAFSECDPSRSQKWTELSEVTI